MEKKKPIQPEKLKITSNFLKNTGQGGEKLKLKLSIKNPTNSRNSNRKIAKFHTQAKLQKAPIAKQTSKVKIGSTPHSFHQSFKANRETVIDTQNEETTANDSKNNIMAKSNSKGNHQNPMSSKVKL